MRKLARTGGGLCRGRWCSAWTLALLLATAAPSSASKCISELNYTAYPNYPWGCDLKECELYEKAPGVEACQEKSLWDTFKVGRLVFVVL